MFKKILRKQNNKLQQLNRLDSWGVQNYSECGGVWAENGASIWNSEINWSDILKESHLNFFFFSCFIIKYTQV